MNNGVPLSRAVRGATVAVAAIALLASCSGNSSSGDAEPDGPVTLRFSTFGDPSKLEAREAVAKLYTEQSDGVTIAFEGSPGSSYGDKINTQIAANNAPDVINVAADRLYEYARSGVLAPLDDFTPEPLDIGTFSEPLLNQGIVDGELVGIPVAQAMMGVVVDKTGFEEIGLDVPDGTWTWDEYFDTATEIHEVSDGALYGAADGSGDYFIFETWLIGQGKTFYTDEGELAFDEDDLRTWLELWQAQRESGGIPPADVAAEYLAPDWPNSPIATGKGLMVHAATSNFIGGFQALTDHDVDLILPPVYEGGTSGVYPRPSSFLAVNARTSSPEQAAAFVDFFSNSPEAGEKLRLLSGVPGSGAAAKAVAELPDLTSDESEVLAFNELVTPELVAAPPTLPQNANVVNDSLRIIAQEYAFGRLSLDDAVSRFFDDASAALG